MRLCNRSYAAVGLSGAATAAKTAIARIDHKGGITGVATGVGIEAAAAAAAETTVAGRRNINMAEVSDTQESAARRGRREARLSGHIQPERSTSRTLVGPDLSVPRRKIISRATNILINKL